MRAVVLGVLEIPAFRKKVLLPVEHARSIKHHTASRCRASQERKKLDHVLLRCQTGEHAAENDATFFEMNCNPIDRIVTDVVMQTKGSRAASAKSLDANG